MRVSALLGGVAALYFATAVPGEHSGAEFLDDQISRIGGVLAAWEYYRGRSAGGPGPPVRFQMPDRMISLV